MRSFRRCVYKPLGFTRCLHRPIPQELFKLKNLRSLNLYRNQLKVLPEALWELSSLTDINLYRNRCRLASSMLSQADSSRRLTTLPPGISTLKFLRVVNLGSNGMTDVPVRSSPSSCPCLSRSCLSLRRVACLYASILRVASSASFYCLDLVSSMLNVVAYARFLPLPL